MCCLLFYQMAAFDVMDHDVPCVFCAGDLGSGEEERVLLLQCCLSGAHHACLRDKFPDWNFVICPKCDRRTRVTGHVLRRDKFTPEQADKIEYCFVKHQAVRRTPMTSEEIHGLRIALNVRGFRAMRQRQPSRLCHGTDVLVSPSQRQALRLGGHCGPFDPGAALEHGVGDAGSLPTTRTT